jgi:prefoldin subunit 5
MKFRSFFLLSAIGIVLVIPTIASLEIDRAELQGAGEADIEFENYEGPVEQIDSREAIRGIGRSIGRGINRGDIADYAGRYRVYRIVGDQTEPLRGADIVELDRSARVDHIVNLRRIVAGYLESAWEYGREDADLLARFITIYNAVHRGNVSFFGERYRTAVVEALDAERVGLAISYREWPGRTQLVIPIRDERFPGDLDAVDPRQLIDSAVIAELRTRSDLGIEDRKAIISFIERVIEERTEVIAEERAAIEEEQQEIDQRQEEIEEEIATIEEEQTQAEQPPPEPEEPADDGGVSDGGPATGPAAAPAASTPPQEPQEQLEEPPQTTEPQPVESVPEEAEAEDDTPEAAPQEQRVEELENEQAQLQEREEELQEQREELDEEEEEVEALTEEVEELYQDTAEDQATLDEGGVAELVPFVISNDDDSFELSIVNIDTVDVAGEQTIPVVTRDLVDYQGGLLVAHAGSGRLLLLDSQSLELLEESDTRVVPGARIRIVGQSVLTVVEDGSSFYVGEFDSQLVLLRRSVESVKMETDIVNRGDRLIVQGADGSLRRLDLREFE